MDSGTRQARSRSKRKREDLENAEVDVKAVSRPTPAQSEGNEDSGVDGSDNEDASDMEIDGTDYGSDGLGGENVEDGDSDSDEVDVDGYKESDELLPPCAAYDSKFVEIQRDLAKLAQSVARFLNSTYRKSSQTEKFVAMARNLEDPPIAKRQVIGLLGAASVGKSSLVNLITDIPRLAKALDVGQSCTHVVTLYRKAEPSQVKAFSATIEYFDSTSIAQLLLSALRDWKVWQFEYDDDWSDELRAQHHRAAVTCKETFQAIFCEFRPELAEDDKATEALDELARPEETDIALFMVNVQAEISRMCKDGLESRPDGTYSKYQKADTQGQLRKLLDPLVTARQVFVKASLWPFVKQVTIGVRGSRVLDRCTIADLPGVSDMNQIRVRASFAQIKQCDFLWIVCGIGRIVTDPTVDSSDENVDHDLAKSLEHMGCSLGEYSKLREEIKQVKRKITQLNVQKKKVMKTKAKKNFGPLQEKIEESQSRLETLESQTMGLIVNARNTHVTQSLQSAKAHYMTDQRILNVFCVSNAHYMICKGHRDAAGAVLEATTTGIPSLRRFTLELAAPYVIEALENHINHSFSVFFKGLNLWAYQRLVEGRDSLLPLISQPKGRVEAQAKEYISRVERASTEHNVESIKAQEFEIAQVALNYVNKVLKIAHWSALRAFLRRYGNHNTPSMGRRAFNEEFIKSCRNIFREERRRFEKTQMAALIVVREFIIKSLREIVEKFNENPASMALNMEDFGDSIAAQVRGVRDLFHESQCEFEREIRAILIDATQDHEESYFHGLMRGVYDQCNDDLGKGVKERSLQRFRSELSLTETRSPFGLLACEVHINIIKATKTQCQQLKEGIDRIWESVAQSFDLMTSVKEESRAIGPVRASFKVFLIEANPKFAVLKDDLVELKKRYEMLSKNA